MPHMRKIFWLFTAVFCACLAIAAPGEARTSADIAAVFSSGVAAYDTLFVELAEREAIPLATFDEPVIKAFPRLAMRPRRVPAH